MKYLDGQSVRVGDIVDLGAQMTGVVVCSIDDGIYSPDFLKSDWESLGEGVVVKSDQAGIIHYVNADHDFVLIERAKFDGL